ncbi:hypothetical protein XENOCAPTIV_028779 [Xenoophorus captivus]|uniref:Uncharacterized protein n=1 Tax=Xenoophorus captivus TaxID=1517983 RepID=A0ABV0RE01_9TELE
MKKYNVLCCCFSKVRLDSCPSAHAFANPTTTKSAVLLYQSSNQTIHNTITLKVYNILTMLLTQGHSFPSLVTLSKETAIAETNRITSSLSCVLAGFVLNSSPAWWCWGNTLVHYLTTL